MGSWRYTPARLRVERLPSTRRSQRLLPRKSLASIPFHHAAYQCKTKHSIVASCEAKFRVGDAMKVLTGLLGITLRF